MSDADLAIVTRGLTKTFTVARRHEGRFAGLRSLIDPIHEHRTVVDDLTMSVEKGELVALLGPNGAGKSTSIKMLTGVLTPSAGEVFVDGRIPHRDRIANARNIGAVFGQKTQLWWDLPVKQSFAILRDIFDVPQAIYDRQLADFNAILELAEFWDTPVRHSVPRPAGALRDRRRHVARPVDRVPGRADDRHGRCGEGADPPVLALAG